MTLRRAALVALPVALAAIPVLCGERDRQRDESGAAKPHDQDLLIDQSTLVSSFGLMLTFSVFLPSSLCQTSTS